MRGISLLIAVLLVCLQIATLVSATLVNESREKCSSEAESMLFSGFRRPRKFYPKLQNDLKSFKSIDTKANIINPGSDFSLRCKSTEFKQVVIGKLSQSFALDASTKMCSAAKSKCTVNMCQCQCNGSVDCTNKVCPTCSKSSLKTAVNNAEVYESKGSALSDRKCFFFLFFFFYCFFFFFPIFIVFFPFRLSRDQFSKRHHSNFFFLSFVKNMPCLIGCHDCFLWKLTECCCYFQLFRHPSSP